MVTFDPPSVNGRYEVELGREFSLSCMFNRNIYPTPIQFDISRASEGTYATINFIIIIIPSFACTKLIQILTLFGVM